jgi:FMN phosphatase YigB (HAD superfamily)
MSQRERNSFQLERMKHKSIYKMENKAIIWDWIGTLYDRNNGPYPFAPHILKELQPRFKHGLVSIARNGVDNRRIELEDSGIMHYFDSVIIDTKKTPNHYLRCIEVMGTTPRTTIIVDDRTVRGIKIGNELGCETYWIQNGEYAHEIPNEETGQPSWTLSKAEDLIGLI